MTTSASTPYSRGGVGDRLGVVAGGDRDHAAALLLVGQARELVERAARLEGAGALEELALEAGAERARGEHRRAEEVPLDDRARAEDVVAAQPRWRTASKRRIAAAVAALRLSALPRATGIETRRSAASSQLAARPSSSAPTAIATGRVRSASV